MSGQNQQYTPDEETVREQYSREQPPHIGTVSEKRAEVDRFIAQVRRDAVRDARAAFYAKYPQPPMLGGEQLPGEKVGARHATDVVMNFLADYADEQEK